MQTDTTTSKLRDSALDPRNLTLESVAAHVNETHAENERLFTEWWNGQEAGLYTDRLWHVSNVRRETLRMLAQSAFYNGLLAGLQRVRWAWVVREEHIFTVHDLAKAAYLAGRKSRQ